MTASLAAGQPVTIGSIASIADGLLAVRPGDTTFLHVRAFVDRVVTIEDEAIIDAMRWLFAESKLVAEPSGAITVAAAHADAREGRVPGSGATVAVVSGGNVEASAFAKYLQV
jgi:threonine dehydratase